MAKEAVMPKGANGRTGGNSKLRFIMLEADLADGDLSQITSAITNALKPQTLIPIHRPGLNSGPASVVNVGELEDVGSAGVLSEDEDETDSGATQSSTPRRSREPRSYRTPERLDLDISGFKAFAKAKDPSEVAMKHLVAAVWFKEHFNTPEVNVDHVYSAYLDAGWSTNIIDFDQPFRRLKKRGLVKRVKPGTYTVTFPGLNAVKELGNPGSETDASS